MVSCGGAFLMRAGKQAYRTELVRDGIVDGVGPRIQMRKPDQGWDNRWG
jgi:hypothetical protein